ncbi:MAG: ABC transporter substrate-binding protein [Oscillospiraceae bacterium]|nr:ABC transporter substrate-binding protein [Oscillospiraceae bacterium]
MKISDTGTLEPWLAESWKMDGNTWTIQLKDGIKFSNGKPVDAAAVKACFERLLSQHERAKGDLNIQSMSADGLTLTIKTKGENITLMNDLCDPYASIIDVSEKIDTNTSVVGTGPYKLIESNLEGVYVEKNENYWNGEAKVDKINFISFSDPDTLGMALQNGDLDAAYGLTGTDYVDLIQKTDGYKISQVPTSTRNIGVFYNTASGFMQDAAVRRAISMCFDKESFCEMIMSGDAEVATSAFPSTFPYGDGKVSDVSFDIDGAKKVLSEAGYVDTDGDGYVDKDGKNVTIKWVTYGSEDSLPKLAEVTQANLKQVGIKADIEVVDSLAPRLQEGKFDLFGMVYTSTATGDPQYYFTNFFEKGGGYSYTNFEDKEFSQLLEELKQETDTEKRGELSVKLEQILLDKNVCTQIGHKKSVTLMKAGVTGMDASMSDFYITTVDTDINQ